MHTTIWTNLKNQVLSEKVRYYRISLVKKNENIMYHLVYSEGSLTDQERWC